MNDNPAIFDKPDMMYDIKMGNQQLHIEASREVIKDDVTFEQCYIFAFSMN